MRSVLVQMAGHGGSGKSTLARKIAEDVQGTVIDLDTIKTSLLDSGAGWHEASAWSYAIIYALVDDSLDIDGSWVIVDTPSYWPEIYEKLTHAADAHGANYAFIECHASESTRSDRLARRPTRRSQVRDHDAPPVDAPNDTSPPHHRGVHRPPDRLCLQVDTDAPLDVRKILAQLPFCGPPD